jgi:hypothetical protein
MNNYQRIKIVKSKNINREGRKGLREGRKEIIRPGSVLALRALRLLSVLCG